MEARSPRGSLGCARSGSSSSEKHTLRRVPVPDTLCHPPHNQNKPSSLSRGVYTTRRQLSTLCPREGLHVPSILVLVTVVTSLLVPGAWGHPLGASGHVWQPWDSREKREIISDDTVGAIDPLCSLNTYHQCLDTGAFYSHEQIIPMEINHFNFLGEGLSCCMTLAGLTLGYDYNYLD